jgi:hypothetical protein
MKVIYSLCSLGVAYANECSNFCEAQLGTATCKPIGTYCKNGHACHGIFWTSDARTSICVQGSAECSSQIPVLCSEASSGVGGSASAEVAITETTTTVRPRNLLRNPFGNGEVCFESYVPPSNGGDCKCCPNSNKNH